jgi:hypothetical protein
MGGRADRAIVCGNVALHSSPLRVALAKGSAGPYEPHEGGSGKSPKSSGNSVARLTENTSKRTRRSGSCLP